MVTDALPSLYPELEERQTPPGKNQYGYYRRKRDGWIMMAPVWPTFRQDMEFKGLEYLNVLGTFVHDTGDKVQRDLNGRNFSVAKEPWRLIFQHPKGTALFPLSQIIAYRWHIRPPYREVKFPQVEGVKIYDLFCPECEKGIFSSDREQDAIDMLRTHLTSRFNDAHAYRPEDLKTLGAEYGIDFFAPRRGRNSVRRDAQSEEAPSTAPDLTPSEELRCECGFEAKSTFGLQTHQRSHKAEPS